MTVAAITTHACAFSSVPCKRTWDALPSTTYTGGHSRYDAHFEFWLFKDGNPTPIASSIGYGPQWGHIFTEAGDYECVLRVRVPGDADYSEARWSETLTAPTYTYEQYVDDSAVNDLGAGTIGDPIKTLAEAATRLAANWSDNATHRHAIHLKRGENWDIAAVWIQDLAGTRRGSLVIDPYGAGADPIINITNDSMLLRRRNREHYAVVDIDVRGPGSASHAQWIYDCITTDNGGAVRGEGAFLISGGNVQGVGSVYYNRRDGGSTYVTNDISNGWFDSRPCIQNLTVDDTASFEFLSEHTRHGFVKGCTLSNNDPSSANPGSNDSRWAHLQHFCYIENDTAVRTTVNTTFRVGVDTQTDGDADGTHSLTIGGNLGFQGATWSFGRNGGSGGAIFDDVWFCRNKIDNQATAYPLGESATEFSGIDGLVIRGNQLSAILWAIRFVENGSDPSDNVYIDGNSFHCTTGAFGFSAGVRLDLTQVQVNSFKNNLYIGTGNGTGHIWYGNSVAAITQVEDSNYNLSYQATGTNRFYGDFPGLSPTTGTLAQWQSATVHDDNSLATNPLVVSTTSGSLDLSIQSGSPADNAGEAAPAAFVDYFGHLTSTTTPCIGAHEFGSSTEPTAPSLAAEGDVPIGWRNWGMLRLGLGLAQTI